MLVNGQKSASSEASCSSSRASRLAFCMRVTIVVLLAIASQPALPQSQFFVPMPTERHAYLHAKRVAGPTEGGSAPPSMHSITQTRHTEHHSKWDSICHWSTEQGYCDMQRKTNEAHTLMFRLDIPNGMSNIFSEKW